MGEDSPKNKVKFLCSYGGKVLPRPSDGLLRYVGGETRVISVSRDVTFTELMKKVSNMVELGEMVLKYQLVPEDLDALVSVRTEEDMKHMIEEHDRHHNGLLRAFLFPPPKAGLGLNLTVSEPYPLEQRYIDAINGIIRTSPRATKGSASACSSPKSSSPDAADQHSPRFVMQRVQSSPSLTNLSGLDHPHHHHQYHPFHNYSFQSTSRPPQDPQLGNRLGAGSRFNFHYSNTRQGHSRGGGGGGGGYPYPDDSSSAYAHIPIERLHNLSRSPRRKSVWE